MTERLEDHHARHADVYNPIDPGWLRGAVVGPWVVVDDFCACRSLKGADPEDVAMRVAFIEKVPRVRVNTVLAKGDRWRRGWSDSDYKNWVQGYRGDTGGDPETDLTYGFDPNSRDWCDEMLRQLGAVLEDAQ